MKLVQRCSWSLEDEKIWKRNLENGMQLDGYEFPVNDEAQIVRCVHEGCCPTCGRGVVLIESEEAPWMKDSGHADNEWVVDKVTCSEGHVAFAEPNRSGTDFVGYIG